MTDLFDPVVLGSIECRNRIAMAPCTRCMSPDFLPTANVVEYYRRRAADGVGLLISEGTVITPRGSGYLDVPGIFDPSQAKAWKRVTNAVHDEGGRMICQIWHVGNVAHRRTTGGLTPESPSGIAPEGHVSRIVNDDGQPVPFEAGEAMTEARIHEVIDLFRSAAGRAMEAGFDGVEIHGAHGYLIDQFTNLAFNHRTDEWGGIHRTRFAREVTHSVIGEIGSDRTVFRFSPLMSVANQPWLEAESTFELLLTDLWEAGLRILHASNLDYDQPILRSGPEIADPDLPLHRACRQHWSGQLIGVGSLDPSRAARAIEDHEVDVVAFGRSLIANPDFCHRLRSGLPLRDYDPQMLATLD